MCQDKSIDVCVLFLNRDLLVFWKNSKCTTKIWLSGGHQKICEVRWSSPLTQDHLPPTSSCLQSYFLHWTVSQAIFLKGIKSSSRREVEPCSEIPRVTYHSCGRGFQTPSGTSFPLYPMAPLCLWPASNAKRRTRTLTNAIALQHNPNQLFQIMGIAVSACSGWTQKKSVKSLKW